jgi:large subunit ribosomal protein L16
LSLRPRKFLHKNIHKRRSFRFSKPVHLSYGQVGVVLLQPIRLNSKQIFRYKLFFKKTSRKTDKTLRFVWFNLFPHIPLSRKVEGSRMGKGKGKLAGWATELPAGITIFEFKNLRYGRALYFSKQAAHKLPAKTKIIKKFTGSISAIWNLNKRFSYDVIW